MLFCYKSYKDNKTIMITFVMIFMLVYDIVCTYINMLFPVGFRSTN